MSKMLLNPRILRLNAQKWKSIGCFSTSNLSNFVGGSLTSAKDGETVENINPATLEVISHIFPLHI